MVLSTNTWKIPKFISKSPWASFYQTWTIIKIGDTYPSSLRPSRTLYFKFYSVWDSLIFSQIRISFQLMRNNKRKAVENHESLNVERSLRNHGFGQNQFLLVTENSSNQFYTCFKSVQAKYIWHYKSTSAWNCSCKSSSKLTRRGCYTM